MQAIFATATICYLFFYYLFLLFYIYFEIKCFTIKINMAKYAQSFTNNRSLFMKNPNQSRLVVFLSWENLDDLRQNGYCGNWRTATWRAKRADYLLVAHNKNNNEQADGNLKHGEGFLLVKISEITTLKTTKKGKETELKRFHFQKYAKISIKKAWQILNPNGGQQPFTYYDDSNNLTAQDAFDLLGLDFDSLIWETLPPKDELSENSIQNNIEQYETIQAEILPLPVAVARAKALIAKHTGIDESAIHISFDDF